MKYLTEVVLFPPQEEGGMFIPQEPYVEVTEIDSYEELEQLLYMVGDIVKVGDGAEISNRVPNKPKGKIFKIYHGDESISYRIFHLKCFKTDGII